MSASSLTPPSDILINFLFKALAIDDARDVLPTPGGPTKHRTGPLASGLSCKNNITIISNDHFLAEKYLFKKTEPQLSPYSHFWERPSNLTYLKRKLIYVI
jgi:hypothetical protein